MKRRATSSLSGSEEHCAMRQRVDPVASSLCIEGVVHEMLPGPRQRVSTTELSRTKLRLARGGPQGRLPPQRPSPSRRAYLSRPKPEHAVSVEIPIPFHDCDPLFVVWHGRYMEYMGQARCALLASCGLDIPDVRALGFRMFVTDLRCRYTFPLSYGETARVTAWFTDLPVDESPLVKVAYEVYNLDHSRVSARASTRLALTDADGRLYTQLPEIVLERLPRS